MRVVTALFSLLSLATAQQWAIERHRLATILFGVSFINEDYGIVTGGANGVGSAVFLTQNGGANYRSLPTEGQPPPGISMFLSAHLASPTSAAAAGLCSWCFVATGIEYSTDGQRFQLANDPAQGFPPVAAAQGGSYVKGLSRAHFGFVGTWGILDMDTGASDVGIRHSTDAGVTWQKSTISYDKSGCRYMAMPSSLVWYITCGTWPRTQTPVKELLSGVTRLSEKLAIRADNTTGVQWEGAEDVSAGAINGYSTAILKTENGGATYTVVYEQLDGDFYLNNLDCLDIYNCYTVGDGLRPVGLRTADGGRTWTELNLGLESSVSVMDIKFVNAREGFVAGGILTQQVFRGIMLHTLDGGTTFSRQEVNGIYPVSIALYTKRDGSTGGHGVGLTPEGQASTIKYA